MLTMFFVKTLAMLVTLSAMRRPVRDEEDATGTHIGSTGGAHSGLVLTVADIVLSSVNAVLIMIMSIMETTAMENVNGVVLLGYRGIVLF